MPIQRAITAFKTERLNCVQSVLRAFQQQMGVSEYAVEQARQLGGGRAEEGRCGALHAALRLIEDEKTRNRVHGAFVARTGSEKCREIRKRKALTCVQCVELAAALLMDYHEGTNKSEQECL